MKSSICFLFCILTFSIWGHCQCIQNPDSSYDRQKLLMMFDDILKASIPAYAKFPLDGFFIYDLTEPTNKYIPKQYAKAEGCVNFIDKHIYHFAPIEYEDSLSHIAILENGSLKTFKLINCANGENTISDAIRYIEKKIETDKKEDVLIRLGNYRRYGFYLTDDSYRVYCNFDKELPKNTDRLYNRGKVLNQFADVLRSSVSENVQSQFSRFLVEEERGVGFFVWDLTEPSNKQTSLLERVEFKNNHVYHFAFIDSPFSFSNIAVLEEGKLKIFKNINCSSKGDSLEDVIGYLNQKLKTDKNKKEILKRVKNYHKYGVYASFDGFSTPQCEEIIKTAEK